MDHGYWRFIAIIPISRIKKKSEKMDIYSFMTVFFFSSRKQIHTNDVVKRKRRQKNRRKRFHKPLPLVWTTHSIWNTNQQEVNFRLMFNMNDFGYFYIFDDKRFEFCKYTLQICITKRVYFTRSPPLTFYFMTTSINQNEVIPLLVISLILLLFEMHACQWLLCTVNCTPPFFNL